jgi:hypothetical protein
MESQPADICKIYRICSGCRIAISVPYIGLICTS